MNKANYPALWQFFGAYLHQDWHEDYADTHEALSDFMDGEPAFTPTIATEIDRLLAATATSQDAEAAIAALGSFFVPSAVGEDSREWLLSLRDEASHLLQRG